MTTGRQRALLLAANAAAYLAHPRLVWSFRRRLGAWPNASAPATVHEKYLWRKLFDRAPWQTELSDKLLAKDFVRSRCPDIRIPETLWTGVDLADCPDRILNASVALKATHGCGFNRLIVDGKADRGVLLAETRRWLRTDYSRRQGQWAYREIVPRLFAEELLLSDGRLADREYKVYVGAGRAVYTYVSFDRFAEDRPPSSDLLDPGGELIPGAIDVGTPRRMAAAPPQYRQIVAAAEAIARDVDFLRCDFYLHRDEVWFSEATIYSAGGYAWVEDSATMDRLNRAWDLRRSSFLRSPQRGWRLSYAAALRSVLPERELPETGILAAAPPAARTAPAPPRP